METIECQVMVLPSELEKIAVNVSIEKRTEAQNVLNNIFSGVTKIKAQLDNVVVTGVDDKLNMKLANTIRLNVRKMRLDAEKIFDAKRDEVQQQMANYKTEDALWLKAKQIMQLLTKDVEESARWKEETEDRYIREQEELKKQQRISKVLPIAPDLLSAEFENMSDESFEIFYADLKKAHNEKIEASRIEEEKRLAKIKADEEERKRLAEENEKLKAEAEEREKEKERQRTEQEERDRIANEKAEAERKKQEEIIENERKEKEAAQKEADRLRKEQEERDRVEAERVRIENLRIEEENERKLSASDSEKIKDLVELFESIAMPQVQSKENKKLLQEIETDVKNIVKKLKEVAK